MTTRRRTSAAVSSATRDQDARSDVHDPSTTPAVSSRSSRAAFARDLEVAPRSRSSRSRTASKRALPTRVGGSSTTRADRPRSPALHNSTRQASASRRVRAASSRARSSSSKPRRSLQLSAAPAHASRGRPRYGSRKNGIAREGHSRGSPVSWFTRAFESRSAARLAGSSGRPAARGASASDRRASHAGDERDRGDDEQRAPRHVNH